MRRFVAALLLTAVLVSSLPWELSAELLRTDPPQVSTLDGSSSDSDSQRSPPATDLCFCLCMGCPGSAVEGFSPLLGISADINLVPITAVPPDQTHASDVHSRFFRPPRSA
jgi:hypothetical protein